MTQRDPLKSDVNVTKQICLEKSLLEIKIYIIYTLTAVTAMTIGEW